MKKSWSILYRGPLSSCNYSCGYCSFAKTRSNREDLQQDELCLKHFTDWVAVRCEEIGILFTPWGEGLTHRWYQRALCELSHLPSLRRVAIQTNLSCSLQWLVDAVPQKLGLWCTFHPTQVTLERFLGQCRELDRRGIHYSVGMVGTRESLPLLGPLRAGLRPEIYIWVNAFKRDPTYYTAVEIALISGFDPLFPTNNQWHPSLGRACRTGHTVFSVDGKGDIRRCHFVKSVIGNIYDVGFERALQPRSCSAEACGCHIGYVHLEDLGLDAVYGEGILERIPLNHQIRCD